jgi:D-3-phosphoglycerate dehydrogenase / 2-oxoglutarate reductase
VNALILAPFAKPALDRLGSRMGIIYRSWTETQTLLEPEQFLEFINKDDVQIIVLEADFIFEEVFEGTDSLRFVGVCRGTVNNVDLDSATQHRVLVVNAPARNSIAVAELTLGLALSLARRIPQAHKIVRSGQWEDPIEPYTSLRGIELYGKTAGLVGFGSIGKEVAQRFKVFGMPILAYDPHIAPIIMLQAGVKPVDLNTLVQESDFISIHCSAGEQTRGIIGPEEINRMKSTAYVINTASWDVIEEKALLESLSNHSIAGAAFDIFASHPLSLQSPLLKMENVILTPHIGGATDNTITRYSGMITEDIFRFLEGQRPLNLLNSEVWRA